MATAGALEYQELTSEGKNLSLQRCTNLKDLPSRRKQRENDREHVAEKLQRRLPKFNQFSQNGVFGRALRMASYGGGIYTADDLRVYNRALSAAEIQAIYNAQK